MERRDPSLFAKLLPWLLLAGVAFAVLGGGSGDGVAEECTLPARYC